MRITIGLSLGCKPPRTEVADGEMFDSSLLRGQSAEVYEMSEAVDHTGRWPLHCIPNGDPYEQPEPI